MRQRTPSPPLITGIDGIVSRPPNEVNYSPLNGKMMKTGKPTENRIPRRNYKNHGIKKMEGYYVKKEENGNLIEPGDEKEIVIIKKGIGSDGEEDGKTGEPQWQKCGISERKYRKYGLKKMGKYVKDEENAGKIKNRMETCN